jgi:hypothetical protein
MQRQLGPITSKLADGFDDTKLLVGFRHRLIAAALSTASILSDKYTLFRHLSDEYTQFGNQKFPEFCVLERHDLG